MGNSLQDQLLKAGLVSKQQAKQLRAAKRKKRRQQASKTEREIAQRARQAAAQKAARDRALNRQREEAARRRAEAHELRQLIHQHRIARADGEIAFYFQDGKTLKHLYVNAEQRRAIAQGKLAVVRQDQCYELLPAEIAARIRKRRPELILVLHQETHKAAASEEDPYAEYSVPDDLMW